MIVLNSSDSSLVAYVLTPTDKIKYSLSCIDSNKRIILDSLSIQDYTYEFEYPYYEPPILDFNDEFVKQFIVFIDEDTIGDFLRKSGIKLWYLHYGIDGYTNFEELKDKYGLAVWNMGCVRSSSFDGYMSKVNHLLDLRNGIGWLHHYHQDMLNLERHEKLEQLKNKLTPECKVLITFLLH